MAQKRIPAPMITKDKVVSLSYNVTDGDGNALEMGEPEMSYLHGHQNLFPALEEGLSGLIVGSTKQITLEPEQAYGPYNPQLRFTAKLEQFGGQAPEAGMMVELQPDQGNPFVAQVVQVEGDDVFMDANHPLAGKTLNFDITVKDIRDASPEELTHGHHHGPGGHHH